MTTDEYGIREANAFKERIEQPHRRVDPCFMTGKACVYSEVIDREIEDRRRQKLYCGFTIMPFRQNIRVFFKNCLVPFLCANYGKEQDLTICAADEVRRPGVIICEGICKRIQESDFILADLSVPNPNVFYELGLAYGLDHKIIVVHHIQTGFGGQMTDRLRDLGCRAYPYKNLDPLELKDFSLTQFLWRNPGHGPGRAASNPRILFYERLMRDGGNGGDPPAFGGANDDIPLSFADHLKSAIGLAVAEIHQRLSERPESYRVIRSYLPVIAELKDTIPIVHEHPLSQLQQQVNEGYCLVVRTGGADCHPMAYFWLGYCHARGRNVVPITVVESPKDTVADLAFDIRAQRHLTFATERPDLLEGEIRQTLNLMVVSDFAEWSRKHFWNEMFGGGGEISIFTGALHNKDYNREMIGDWDLRTVSELTSYFGRHQHRFKIETPIYPPERLNRNPGQEEMQDSREQYIMQLVDMMYNKNCIVIASPDVNPLTEIVLGTIYGVPQTDWFHKAVETGRYPKAIVAFKEREPAPEDRTDKVERAFYVEIPKSSEGPQRRGFQCSQIIDGNVATAFSSQDDREGKFHVYAHLAIIPNPYREQGVGQRYIIVLNGVSGPATFALTHALTGGVGKEFVAYEDEFRPDAESEMVLSRILEEVERNRGAAVECLIKVEVGPGPGRSQRSSTYDWRRILRWSLDVKAFPDVMKKTIF